MQIEKVIQNGDLHFVDLLQLSPAPMGGVVAVIPAHNEERFIGSVVLATAQYVDSVLIIDDGSTDNTAMVAAAAGARVVSLEKNSGKGAALKRGVELALQDDGVQAIVLMDGDGQHLPRELPQVVQPVLDGTADVVVGSRFLEITSEIPWWRQIGQHSLTWVTNSASGTHLTDSQSGYRALSPDAARLLTFQNSGFSVESEMQFAIREHNLRVEEVPITCVYAEPAKRNPVVQGVQVLDGIFRLVKQTRPMLFLGIPAVIALLLGIVMASGVVSTFHTTQEFAVGYALLTVLFILFGAIGLSTGFVLQSIRSLLLELLKDRRI